MTERHEITMYGLEAGESYIFQARTRFGAYKYSRWSEKFEFTVENDETAPDTPTNVTAKWEGDSFVLEWDEVVASDFDRYVVDVYPTTRPAEAVRFVTSGLKYEFTYNQNKAYFNPASGDLTGELRSRDHAGNLSAPATATAVRSGPGPFTLTGEGDHKAIRLKWDKPTGEPFDRFEIYKNSAYLAQVSGDTLDFHDTSPTRGDHSYYVKCFDKFGGNSTSNTITASATGYWEEDTTPPSPPTITGVTSDAAYNGDGIYVSDIDVTFTPPTTNSDTTAYSDHEGFEITWSKTSATGPWQTGTMYDERVNGTDAASYTYRIEDVSPGTTYYIRVRAFDRYQNHSSYATTSHATAEPNAPADPTGTVTTEWDGADLQISWTNTTPSGDLKDYQVKIYPTATPANSRLYYSEEKEFSFPFSMNRNTFASPQPALTVEVKQRSHYGSVSANPISAATTNPTPAFDLDGLQATGERGAIRLNWDEPDEDISYYEVYRNAAKIATTTGQTLIDADPGKGTHSYYVTAFDVFGQNATTETESAEAIGYWEGDTTAPGTPTQATSYPQTGLDNDDGSAAWIEQRWNPITDTDGDFSHYEIRLIHPDTTKDIVRLGDIADDRARFRNLATGASYTVEVRAVDQSDNKSAALSATLTSAADTNAPATPTGLSVSGGIRTMTASWNPNSETDLKGYELHASLTSAFIPDATTLKYKGDGTSASWAAGDSETWYAVVRAFDVTGNQSAYSAEVSGTSLAAPEGTDSTPPGTPTGLALTPSTYYHGSTERGKIDATWTANAEGDLAGYTIAIRKGSVGGFNTHVVDGAENTFTFYGVDPNNTYEVKIKAFDSNQNESTYSAIVSTTVTSSSSSNPATPTAFAATTAQGGVQLTWTPVSGDGINDYHIQVATDNLFSANLRDRYSSGNSYLYEGTPGTTYYARIKARDIYGNESTNWSATVSAMAGYTNNTHIQADSIDADRLQANTAFINNLNVESTFTMNAAGNIVSSNYNATAGSEAGYKMGSSAFEFYGGSVILGGGAGLNLSTVGNRLWFGNADWNLATLRVDGTGDMRVGGDGKLYIDGATGDIWSGNAAKASAPWEISGTGAARFDNVKITGASAAANDQIVNVSGNFIVTKLTGTTAKVNLAGDFYIDAGGDLILNGGNVSLTSGNIALSGGDFEVSSTGKIRVGPAGNEKVLIDANGIIVNEGDIKAGAITIGRETTYEPGHEPKSSHNEVSNSPVMGKMVALKTDPVGFPVTENDTTFVHMKADGTKVVTTKARGEVHTVTPAIGDIITVDKPVGIGADASGVMNSFVPLYWASADYMWFMHSDYTDPRIVVYSENDTWIALYDSGNTHYYFVTGGVPLEIDPAITYIGNIWQLYDEEISNRFIAVVYDAASASYGRKGFVLVPMDSSSYVSQTGAGESSLGYYTYTGSGTVQGTNYRTIDGKASYTTHDTANGKHYYQPFNDKTIGNYYAFYDDYPLEEFLIISKYKKDTIYVSYWDAVIDEWVYYGKYSTGSTGDFMQKVGVAGTDLTADATNVWRFAADNPFYLAARYSSGTVSDYWYPIMGMNANFDRESAESRTRTDEWRSSGTTTIDGGKITTDTIDASSITTSTLTSASITLDGGAFRGSGTNGSFIMDGAGIRFYGTNNYSGSPTINLDTGLGTGTFEGNIVANTGTLKQLSVEGTITVGNGATTGQIESDNYVADTSGWVIKSDGSVEFSSGKFRGDITGSSGSFSGSLDIGGSDATSFHVDTGGNMWLGDAQYVTAPFSVSSAGALIALNADITGQITAESGSITGNMAIGTGGSLTVGTSPTYDVILNSDGLVIRNGEVHATAMHFNWGGNLMPVAYADFEYAQSWYDDNIVADSGVTVSSVATDSRYREKSLKIAIAGTTSKYVDLAPTLTSYNLRLKENTKYILSFYGKRLGTVSGEIGLSIWDGTTALHVPMDIFNDTVWTRRSASFTTPAGYTKAQAYFTIKSNSVNTFQILVDGVQLEEATSDSNNDPSPFRAGGITEINGGTIRTGQIRSNDFVAGSTGWNIDLEGDVEFNEGVFRSRIEVGSGNNIFIVDPSGGGAGKARMWLGAALFANAPFSVDELGNLVASKATITGTVNATGGSFGEMDITDRLTIKTPGYITSDNYNTTNKTGFYLSENQITVYTGYMEIGTKFKVDTAGNLTASNANLTGLIYATGGEIKGNMNVYGILTLGTSTSSGYFRSSSSNARVEIDYNDVLRFYNNSTTAAYTVNATDASNLLFIAPNSAGKGVAFRSQGNPWIRLQDFGGTKAQITMGDGKYGTTATNIINSASGIRLTLSSNTEDRAAIKYASGHADLAIRDLYWRNGNGFMGAIADGVNTHGFIRHTDAVATRAGILFSGTGANVQIRQANYTPGAVEYGDFIAKDIQAKGNYLDSSGNIIEFGGHTHDADATDHNHDGRYWTETESDKRYAYKHNHPYAGDKHTTHSTLTTGDRWLHSNGGNMSLYAGEGNGNGKEWQSRWFNNTGGTAYYGFAGKHFRTASLEAYKEDINIFTTSALPLIENMIPKRFRFKAATPRKKNKPELGFIAEEVPSEVRDGDGYQVVGLLALAIKAIQELSASVNTLTSRVDALEL